MNTTVNISGLKKNLLKLKQSKGINVYQVYIYIYMRISNIISIYIICIHP